MQDDDNTPSNPRALAGARTIGDIIASRLTRRGFVSGMAAASGLALAACGRDGAADGLGGNAAGNAAGDNGGAAMDAPAFDFKEIARGLDETHHLPADYDADILLRWGDALFPDSPAFDPQAQSADAQRRQFGYNNDFIGFWPLAPRDGEEARGILCVNHEYVSTLLMQPGLAADYPESMTRERCETEMAAHGGTVVEIAQRNGKWAPVLDSTYNRRITAGDTAMEITGPAAGHPRLRTGADPTGRAVTGTVNNCAGGVTPWGSYLMAEENFNAYFLGALPEDHPEAENYGRYGLPGGGYQWGRHVDRFNVAAEPNEPNRFGWVVEVDILNPASTPKKRTALGRFKHEGAETVLAPDGRVVIYMGDDQRFDYVYKFVSARAYDEGDREANLSLLDEGTLYVARFEDDGTLEWMPLVFGKGPLTPENGFASQGEVLIEARRAADLLGATPMDRPEDVEADPKGGRVWVMLTNNSQRTADQTDAANPRAENIFGHIIEINEPDGDFAATRSRWEILIKCGDPDNPEFGAAWNPLTSENGWFGAPDNCAVDPFGRLWVATDGNRSTGAADGLWAIETDGARRGAGRAFFRAPIGAEVCGPRFAADGATLFLSVQHPGDGRGATFEAPTTRWPDFDDAAPPRPAVVAVRRKNGGPIGGPLTG